MSFRDNLQQLRATRNMTQMQLAMLLGVSRQSVSKWESERAYPEIDKLIKLCGLFDCTLDELIMGDLTGRSADVTASMPDAAVQDVTGYDQLMRSFAWRCALSVSIPLLIIATTSQLVLSGWIGVPDREGCVWMSVWIGVVIGFMIMLSALVKRHGFRVDHPSVENFYTLEEKRRARPAMLASLLTGIALSAASITALLVLALERIEVLDVSVPLILLAPGMFLVIWSSLMALRTDVARYNEKCLAKLSALQIDEIDEDKRRERALMLRRERAWRTVIMCLATAFALPLIADADLGARPFCWLPLAVGAILCGAMHACMSLQSFR